jgi:hypothetical protein
MTNPAPLGLDAVDLIEIARKANQAGKKTKVDHLLCLALGCLQSNEIPQQPSPPPALGSAAGDPAAAFASPQQIHHYLCRLLRDREIGWRFTFTQAANYIESLPDLRLDRTIIATERRERWRNHVSVSIEKLRSFGCLSKGSKNTEYVLMRKP